MQHRADFGIAFDGDGDRLAMADRDGTIFDGDQLLYAMVKHRHGEGRLAGGVAGTLMTNFALERRLKEMGVDFARAKVGDRYVLEMLLEKSWRYGGENSRPPALPRLPQHRRRASSRRCRSLRRWFSSGPVAARVHARARAACRRCLGT
jgi:hypothetical protein